MRIDLYKIPSYQDQTRPFPIKLVVGDDCIIFLPEQSQMSANLHQKQICIVYLPQNLMKAVIKKVPKWIKSQSSFEKSLRSFQSKEEYLKSEKNIKEFLLKMEEEHLKSKEERHEFLLKSKEEHHEFLLKLREEHHEFQSEGKAFRSRIDTLVQGLNDFNNGIKCPPAVNHNDAIVMSIARHTNIIVQENLKTARWFETLLKVIQSAFFFFKDTLFSLVR